MTKALTLALEALEANQPINYCMNNKGEKFPMMQEDPFRFERNTKAITAIKEALAQSEQDSRRLRIAMRQWEDWKTYALELQKKLVKYEGGSPMLLNTQTDERNFCPRCGKRTADIHTCTPPQSQWVGLTNAEMESTCAETWSYDPHVIARAIEAKLKEKNK